MTDKRIIRISSASILAVLLTVLILPLSESSSIVAAIFLFPAAALLPLFIKKRSILSINKSQILLIMTVIALVYLMLYYVTGLEFGFYKNPYGLNFSNFFKFLLPIATVITATEVIRYVFIAQNDRVTNALC